MKIAEKYFKKVAQDKPGLFRRLLRKADDETLIENLDRLYEARGTSPIVEKFIELFEDEVQRRTSQ